MKNQQLFTRDLRPILLPPPFTNPFKAKQDSIDFVQKSDTLRLDSERSNPRGEVWRDPLALALALALPRQITLLKKTTEAIGIEQNCSLHEDGLECQGGERRTNEVNIE